MDPLPVTIIVKAPNQQFEDQTIKCEPTWSIRKLKGYLTEVYPCNPTLEEQKLIYSGQLLNDAHILKDVLRRFEGQETHTVHLVYTPKNRQQQQQSYGTKPSQSTNRKDTNQQSRSQTSHNTQQSQPTTTTTDGLRHRNVGSEPSTTSNGPQSLPGYMINAQQFMPGAWMPPNPAQQSVQQYMMAQQMAMQNMMNQMYMQYMNQYGNTFPNMNSGSTQMPQYPQMNQFNQPNFGNVWNPNVQNANSIVDLRTQQQQQQQPAEQVPPVPAPQRFQANNDEEENRDWLEILYTVSRLLVLSSLVYFYSSPGRCSIVIIVALLYYLYQSHQRNVREQQQQEQGQIDRDADADIIDAPPDNNNEQQQGENNANAENGEAADSLPASNEGTPSGGEQDENNRLPTAALLRTFILSFFSSLIPETPAV